MWFASYMISSFWSFWFPENAVFLLQVRMEERWDWQEDFAYLWCQSPKVQLLADWLLRLENTVWFRERFWVLLSHHPRFESWSYLVAVWLTFKELANLCVFSFSSLNWDKSSYLTVSLGKPARGFHCVVGAQETFSLSMSWLSLIYS